MLEQINKVRRALSQRGWQTEKENAEALTALAELEAAMREPVALLVRKNSWNEGQWECAPPNTPHYGLTWANQRMFVFAAPPAQQAQPPGSYVEVRECGECCHIDINPSGESAACTHCDWRGPSPEKDQCPGCGLEGTMTGACSKCGARSTFLADANLPYPEQQAQAEAVPDVTADMEAAGAHAWMTSDGVDPEKVFYAMLAAAPRRAEAAPQWQPIETAPKDGRCLLLFYTNRNGLARTVKASWVTDEEAAETDTDGVGLEAGWYESIDNWPDYSQVAIHEGEPTHWMPLPAAPQQKGGAA